MFLVNSRQRLVLATQLRVPLLPKLRGHFAEFLRESYLAPLSILYLPTCVGYMVQAFFIYDSANFSWKSDIHHFSTVVLRIHASALNVFAIYHCLERLNR